CECSASEALHVLLATECGEGFLPLGKNVLRLETPLRKHSAILLRLLGGVAPEGLDGLGFFELQEVESSLTPSFALMLAEENSLHQRLAQCVSIVWERHLYAEFLADLFGLAQDHFKHCT